MFTDPNELTVKLSDLDGAIVAIKGLADGATVNRTLEDGTTISKQPLLASVLVFDGESATAETTLVFPASLQQTIRQASGYVVGRLVKEPHPRKASWTLWQLHKVEGDQRAAAVTAFEAIS